MLADCHNLIVLINSHRCVCLLAGGRRGLAVRSLLQLLAWRGVHHGRSQGVHPPSLARQLLGLYDVTDGQQRHHDVTAYDDALDCLLYTSDAADER